MSSLSARFREVELAFDAPVAVPTPLPQNWLPFTASDSTIRFVDDAFNEETLRTEISRHFGPVRNATIAPMTLRTIFLAIAKSSRKPS
jgi:ABC-2 type transport system ATP-binding protein